MAFHQSCYPIVSKISEYTSCYIWDKKGDVVFSEPKDTITLVSREQKYFRQHCVVYTALNQQSYCVLNIKNVGDTLGV